MEIAEGWPSRPWRTLLDRLKAGPEAPWGEYGSTGLTTLNRYTHTQRLRGARPGSFDDSADDLLTFGEDDE